MKFDSSLNTHEMEIYIKNLIKKYFPDKKKFPLNNKKLKQVLNLAYERQEFCYSNIYDKYFNEKGKVLFNHLNSDHFCSFLYFVSNSAFKLNADKSFMDKNFYLNKIMNCVDIFYTVELPSIFALAHPVGTVLGNANYQDYLYVYQNVVVGGIFKNGKNIYPKLGKGNILYSHVSLIGNTNVGDNVIFGSNTFVQNKNIKSNSIVLGHYPNNKVKNLKDNVIDRYFNIYK